MTAVTSATTTASVTARIERLPASRWHVKVRSLIGAVTFFEAFNQLLIASALPQLIKQWHLTTGQSTFLVTSGSIGMLLGALAAGWCGDRIGRVRLVAIGTALTGITGLALVFSPGLTFFEWLRFVQGIGIGGVVPVAATYINEIIKAEGRGRFVLLYELVFPFGLTIAALVAYWVVPHWGWRALFLVGGLPALVVAALQFGVPESPRWLASRGRAKDAERLLSRIEQAVTRSTGTELPAPEAVAVAGQADGTGGLSDLLLGRYLRRTVVVSLLWFAGYFVNYGLTSWLPTLYTKVFHVSLSTGLLYAVLTDALGLLGCLIAALAVDRLGRRPVLVAGLAGSAIALLILAAVGTHAAGSIAVWSSVAGLFVFGTNISLYLYTPELFPTRSRALGTSVGGVFARIGVILGPTVVGAVLGSGKSTVPVFVVLGLVSVAGAVVALAATETKGRTLEQLNG
jgi:MFS transporter, putative metabolite:H+ symporter